MNEDNMNPKAVEAFAQICSRWTRTKFLSRNLKDYWVYPSPKPGEAVIFFFNEYPFYCGGNLEVLRLKPERFLTNSLAKNTPESHINADLRRLEELLQSNNDKMETLISDKIATCEENLSEEGFFFK